MKAIKRLFWQSKPMYFLLFLIFAINILINILSELFVNRSLNKFSASSIPMSITIFAFVFLLVSSILMITNCFPLPLTMGTTRRKSVQDIYLFNFITCSMISIFIILILVLSSRIIFSKYIIPYLMGYNWNIISGILFKFITLLLTSLFFSSTIMWLVSGFKVKGVFNGLTRIFITLSIIFSQLSIIKDFVLWGQNQLIIHFILFIGVFLAHYLTYRTLIHYELK